MPSACKPSLDDGCLQDECGMTSGDDAIASLLSSAAKPTTSACLLKTVNLGNLRLENYQGDFSLAKQVPHGLKPSQSDANELAASFTSLGPSVDPKSEPPGATTMILPIMQQRHCLGAQQWGRVLLHNLDLSKSFIQGSKKTKSAGFEPLALRSVCRTNTELKRSHTQIPEFWDKLGCLGAKNPIQSHQESKTHCTRPEPQKGANGETPQGTSVMFKHRIVNRDRERGWKHLFAKKGV